MKEQLISFETAKLAKEKGFNIVCRYYYDSDNPLSSSIEIKEHGLLRLGKLGEEYANYKYYPINEAPTQSLLQKWLREKHKIHITIFSSSQESWMFRITKPNQMLTEGIYGEDFITYEEALEVGLQEALKLI